jgi:hypothetical protein
VCESGEKVYTDSYYDWNSGWWICSFHYRFSDGSTTSDSSEYNTGPCD